MYKCGNCGEEFGAFHKKDEVGYPGKIPCCPHCRVPLEPSYCFYISKNKKWIRL